MASSGCKGGFTKIGVYYFYKQLKAVMESTLSLVRSLIRTCWETQQTLVRTATAVSLWKKVMLEA